MLEAPLKILLALLEAEANALLALDSIAVADAVPAAVPAAAVLAEETLADTDERSEEADSEAEEITEEAREVNVEFPPVGKAEEASLIWPRARTGRARRTREVFIVAVGILG